MIVKLLETVVYWGLLRISGGFGETVTSTADLQNHQTAINKEKKASGFVSKQIVFFSFLAAFWRCLVGSQKGSQKPHALQRALITPWVLLKTLPYSSMIVQVVLLPSCAILIGFPKSQKDSGNC